MEYSGSYRERIVLDDGAALELRVIRPSDKVALAEAFRRLSVQSRRQRFLSSKTDLSEEELRALTECDNENDYAIVAIPVDAKHGHNGIVGVARFSRLQIESSVAEIAVAVADEWQRRGLGRRLLKRIVTAAAERGITQVDGMALADNHQINALLRPYAESVRKTHEDGLTRFSFSTLSPEGPGGLQDLYAFLRLVAQGVILVPLRFGRAPLLEILSVSRRRDSRHPGNTPPPDCRP
jgi:GNAT superfamily N-acetyltransferase